MKHETTQPAVQVAITTQPSPVVIRRTKVFVTLQAWGWKGCLLQYYSTCVYDVLLVQDFLLLLPLHLEAEVPQCEAQDVITVNKGYTGCRAAVLSATA